MGRPKKSEQGSTSTAERIILKAMELFAERGYAAVSVRQITRSLSLNEATLYIYYKNKEALLEAIFERWNKKFIEPGFQLPPVEVFQSQENFELGENLIAGAKRFFDKADRETRLTWRILLNGQYRFKSARQGVENQILNAPVKFFTTLLQRYQEAGQLPEDFNSESAGRIIAAVFFEYSFRANLMAAWNEEDASTLANLNKDLRQLGELLQNRTIHQ